MRLLNILTHELEHFTGTNIPPYAIASHRWHAEEATFEDVSNDRNRYSRGAQKIGHFCHFVLDHPPPDPVTPNGKLSVTWLWIDSCCINKNSDAELSESINSMCRWYRAANYCVAYLADANEYQSDGKVRTWQQSVWFRRGWTMQELLAPRCVLFVDCNWAVIGHKCGSKGRSVRDCFGCNEGYPNLNKAISGVTGIPERILCEFDECKMVSIDERMKWTVDRTTTRPEDMVYSLLGIFGVHMPLIYGEGSENAQERLIQLLVRREQTDMSQRALNVRKSLHQHFARLSTIASAPEIGTLYLNLADVHVPSAKKDRIYCIARIGAQLIEGTAQATRSGYLKSSKWSWDFNFTLRTPMEHYRLKIFVCRSSPNIESSNHPGLPRQAWHRPGPCLDILGQLSINLADILDPSVHYATRSESVETMTLLHDEKAVGTTCVTLRYTSKAWEDSNEASSTSNSKAARKLTPGAQTMSFTVPVPASYAERQNQHTSGAAPSNLPMTEVETEEFVRQLHIGIGEVVADPALSRLLDTPGWKASRTK